ncbi:54S ribosomal protein IMG1, mitochondrial [Candida viswanathii]|uniref:54S ribosomal protein IMG1, mitochondrial n=1 Tax=Candida viswanathii TaxID=5486 RepID=A0A367YGB0_9ASCO|nr:54S ribosomal protein IMG1, mitochondrial [Candida viswanathii]
MFGLVFRSMGIRPVIQQARSYHYLRKQLPTVYEPLEIKRRGEPILEWVQRTLLKKHDPLGKRRDLVNRAMGLRAGDIIKVTYLDRSNVTGRVIAIKRGHLNLGSNILIRTIINRVGSELRVPVYNPNLRNIEVLHTPDRYMARSKHYYVREHRRLDVGDIEQFISKTYGDIKAKKDLAKKKKRELKRQKEKQLQREKALKKKRQGKSSGMD